MYDGYPQPWFTKLLVLYLLIILVVFVTRVVRLTWSLRTLRRQQMQGGPASLSLEALWADCFNRARSFKTVATLTFLLSLLNFTLCMSDILFGVRTAKTVNVAFLLPRIGEALVPLSLGLIFCTGLYVGGVLAESALRRCQSAGAAADSRLKNAVAADH
jgi:hypothetical protein